MLTARRVLVSGLVQGVGFRFFIERVARAEGLRGWVKNLADGRVETFLQGDAEAVERAEHKIRRGPARADVQAVKVYEETPSTDLRDFTVQG